MLGVVVGVGVGVGEWADVKGRGQEGLDIGS